MLHPVLTDGNRSWTYIVPCSVIVFLLTPDFDSLVCYVEGVHQFSMGQEESHEIVLLGIRYIKYGTKGRMCLQGQREVGPDRWKVHSVMCADVETPLTEYVHSELFNRCDLEVTHARCTVQYLSEKEAGRSE